MHCNLDFSSLSEQNVATADTLAYWNVRLRRQRKHVRGEKSKHYRIDADISRRGATRKRNTTLSLNEELPNKNILYMY